jgi:hypothetical protein
VRTSKRLLRLSAHWGFDLGKPAFFLWLVGIVMQITGGLNAVRYSILSRRRSDETCSKMFPKIERYQKEAYWALMKIARFSSPRARAPLSRSAFGLNAIESSSCG